MKANEAPEKIILSADRDTQIINDEWVINDYTDSIKIEYIRKDAFIKKAYAWLKTHYRDYMHNPTGKRLEAFFGGDMCNDFVDYIKGE